MDQNLLSEIGRKALKMTTIRLSIADAATT